MNDTEADPLTDKEAEAMLLTLGAALTWEQTDEHRWDSNRFEDQRRDRNTLGLGVFYTIVAELGLKRFAVHLDTRDDIDWNPQMSSSLAAAKVACERHHATGEWQSKHIPETMFRKK